MQQHNQMCPLSIAVLGVLGGLLGPAHAAGIVPPEARLLAPHRAIYDVVLDESMRAEGVSGISGRLVFEFTGNACEGFTQNLRFVMNITNTEGKTTVSDLRTSAWEAADGSRFRFSNTGYDNQEPSEQAAGDAARTDQGVTVKLDRPQPQTLSFGRSAQFPVQHTLMVLAAARAGQPLVSTELYDGAEKGDKVVLASTVIGKPLEAEAARSLSATLKGAEALAGQRIWPITIAYFAKEDSVFGTEPQQEMSARMFENGIMRDVAINYGTLGIKGTLTDLTLYAPTPCPG